MNRNIIFTFCVLLCLTGCGHGQGEHGNEAHEVDHGSAEHDHPTHAEPDHDDHGAEPRLALNDGEKWPVDEHTRASAARIVEVLDDQRTIGSVEDARTLGTALDEELDTLVKGCTMTGAAHDQLHVFLVALFPKVEELQEGTDVERLGLVRGEIASLFEEYGDHFE